MHYIHGEGRKRKCTGSHVVVVKTRGFIFHPTAPLLNVLCQSVGGPSILTRLGDWGWVTKEETWA